MRSRYRLLLAAVAALFAACVSNPDGCPRAGLDSPRRCKRLCVITPRKGEPPLPCTCDANCLCWQMPGHSVNPQPEEAAFGERATDLAKEK
jgi:hypothetical protein